MIIILTIKENSNTHIHKIYKYIHEVIESKLKLSTKKLSLILFCNIYIYIYIYIYLRLKIIYHNLIKN